MENVLAIMHDLLDEELNDANMMPSNNPKNQERVSLEETRTRRSKSPKKTLTGQTSLKEMV